MTAFLIPFSALLITAGRIADMFGRRRILLIGTALFGGGSVLAAVSPQVDVLIGGIAIAGAGGALLMPSSMSILTNVFTDSGRGLAIGLWGAATELVSGIGVLVGGVLTGALSWRWIFVVCIAAAVSIVVLAVRGVPESRDTTITRAVDIAGVVLSTAALTTLTLALIQGAIWGWGSPAIVGLLAASVALFAGFALAERRSKHPVIDFSFFTRRNFLGATIVVFVLDFSFGALLFFLPLYFEEILGASPARVGVLLLPLTCLMVVGSPLGGRITSRVGPLPPIAGGLALMAAAVALISTLSVHTGYGSLWAPSAMMGFGVGLALTPMNLAAMNAIARDHAGAASGVLVTLSGLGATLGVAVTGAIFNELLTERTVGRGATIGVALTRAQAQGVDGVLSGAAGAHRLLARLAHGHGPQLERVVREAFVSSLSTALRISAGLIVLGLVLALALLRRAPPVDAEPEAPLLAAPTPRPAPRLIGLRRHRRHGEPYAGATG